MRMAMPIAMTPAARGIAMTGEGAAPNGDLLRLMTWLSPAFPVGAYTYSHGLEFAVEDGQVATREDLVAWLRVVLHHGCGRLDGGFFTAAWQATDGDDRAAFEAVAAQADAARASAELALEASAQGAAFLQTVTTVWPTPRLTAWAGALRDNDITPTAAIAVALAAADHGIALAPALAAYYHAFLANLVSAGVRLVPLGQTDGQRAMAVLEPEIERAVAAARDRPMADFGTATPMVDWLSIQHETQYTRLFRS